MNSRWARVLTLLVSVALPWPQDCHCVFASHAPKPEHTRMSNVEKPSELGHCCHGDSHANSAALKSPVDDAKKPPFRSCPCERVDAALMAVPAVTESNLQVSLAARPLA